MSDSIFMQILKEIQTQIRALDLTDIPDANVLIHKVPRDLEKDLPPSTPFPCVIIAPIGAETLDANGGTNVKDDPGYPIQVVMLDLDNQDQASNFDRNLLWRQMIRAKLHNRRLANIPEVTRVVVQPGTIVDPGGWVKGKWISGLRVMVNTREARIP